MTRLLESLQVYHKNSGDPVEKSFRLQTEFEKTAAELYRIRSVLAPSDEFRKIYEDRFSELTFEILSIEGAHKVSEKYGFREFYRDYRLIWSNNFSLFLLVLFVFSISLCIGWYFGTEEPSYAALILGPDYMEMMIGGQKWFERIQDNPILAGFQIGLNNILVSIKAATGAALAGVGGILLLVFNGLMIGGVVGFSYANNFEAAISEFIVAHGILELTIIVASCFTGLLFGRGFFMWPPKLMRKRLSQGGREAFIVAIGCLPWLILAAIVEAFVSPFYYLDPFQKLGVGAVVATAFWLFTFWPANPVESTNVPSNKAG